MTIHTFDGDERDFDPDNRTKWCLESGMSVEEAFRKFAGSKTFSIQWEQDGAIMRVTIASHLAIRSRGNWQVKHLAAMFIELLKERL